MSYKLLQGDCLELFSNIEDNSVNAVITDPPYMIGAVSVGNTGGKANGFADRFNAAYWYSMWINEAKRVLTDDGYLCVFTNWRSMPVLMDAFVRSRWAVDSVMVWDKEWIGPAGKRHLRPLYELILFAGMPKAVIDNRCATDIYRCKWQAAHMKTTEHAAEKPVELMRHLIKLTTKPNDLVLDPFMGSGTTGEAALLEGRRFIGIEMEDAYFHDIATPRLQGVALNV
jgi:site-specific DNA-methyltransferase (adenine-specific)